MKLKELLSGISYTGKFDPETEVSGICMDTRKYKAGELFVCIKGMYFDSHDGAVLADLSSRGSRVFVTEHEVSAPEGAIVIRVEDTRAAEALMQVNWYGHPAEEFNHVIGLTGSKGKTTTAFMLSSILKEAGHKAGLICSAGAYINGELLELLKKTTPEAGEIQRLLRKMRDLGCDVAVVEVSSLGMKYHRVDGIHFEYGIWTNILPGDHILNSEHKDFEEYFYYKALFLEQADLNFANAENEHINQLLATVKKPIKLFGKNPACCELALRDFKEDYDAKRHEPIVSFTMLRGMEELGTVRMSYPAEVNSLDALAAACVAFRLGASFENVCAALATVQVPGRTEFIYKGDDFLVCVDQAHNGPSLYHHLLQMKAYRPKRLVCVFGAGGNRDKTRRYDMGKAAAELADFSIITAQHNRFEEFEDIAKDIQVGIKEQNPDAAYIVIPERKDAVRYALEHAQEGDVITACGFGNEDWQEDHGVRKKYCEMDYIKEILREMGREL